MFVSEVERGWRVVVLNSVVVAMLVLVTREEAFLLCRRSDPKLEALAFERWSAGLVIAFGVEVVVAALAGRVAGANVTVVVCGVTGRGETGKSLAGFEVFVKVAVRGEMMRVVLWCVRREVVADAEVLVEMVVEVVVMVLHLPSQPCA